MPRPSRASLVLLSVGGLLSACASAPRAVAVQVAPSAPAPPAVVAAVPEPTPDPIELLIAQSKREFDTGQRDLSLGHLEHAREAFDRALDTLLESPDGARADARLRQHFDALVDRISALEQTAQAAGDGFTATSTDPAAIDTILSFEGSATAPAPATAEAVEADLRATPHDIPIPANDRVLRFVELFQGRLHDFLSEGLSRGAQYLPMIQDVFRKEGLPLDLAYVPLIESAFKPTALSRTRAKGVWQFMRDTGLENGLKSDWYLDERADPEKATVAAARYLKTLYGLFEDWHLAMASYNGGPGRVQRAVTKSRKTDFWTLSASTRYLPPETRDYVPMILAAVIIAKNPAQYGFDVTPASPPPSESVRLPAALDLRRVAEWAGVPMNDIQTLNPEFRRWTTPIRPGEYALRVPTGTADRVRQGLAQAAPGQLNALQWHTVTKGESLVTIARKQNVRRTDLAEANYLRTTSRVMPGQKLVIPRMPSAALLARASGGATDAVAADTDSVAAKASPDDRFRSVYRVRAGDTLYSIARKYGATVDQLRAWNNLRGSRLTVGDRIVLQTTRAANTQQD